MTTIALSRRLVAHGRRDYGTKQVSRKLECHLSRGHIHVSCEESLFRKLHALKAAGPAELHLLTDFDQTLTKAKFSDGTSCDSSFKALITYEGTPEQVRQKTTELYQRYIPIERDQSLSRAEKQ